MEPLKLTDHDLDALREMSNIGAGHAATALSQLLKDVVSLEIPEVRALELQEVPDALGGPERVIVGIHLRVFGEVRGNLLLTFGTQAAGTILERLGLPSPDLHGMSDMGASALRELGNILASTYLTAFSQVLHRSVVPSVPGLAVDMAGAVVDFLLTELAGVSERALVLETAFRELDGPVEGSFFLLPDPEGLAALVEGVRRYR